MKGLLTILTLSTTLTASGQAPSDNMTIGLNLPPLIGNTFDLKLEANPRPHWTYQLTAGLMINNKLQRTYIKVGDGTTDIVNSGTYLAFGARFNTRKQEDKSTYFIGSKLIAGYFDERAWNYRDNIPIERTGFFAAAGLEMGTTIRFTDRFHLDIGFMFALPFYTDQQVSDIYSILPGTGSLLYLQGMLTPKFCIEKDKRENSTRPQ